MVFVDSPGKEEALQIFRKSLLRNRLAHAYLISGEDIDALDAFAILLAKILNCEAPPRRSTSGVGLDFCGRCRVCRRIDDCQQADVSWVRPKSKSRIITIDQIREVLNAVQLKAYALPFKVIVISGADRMNVQASNAFLKTLEEPPARTVLLLLSIDPQRLLNTILSRCLRIRLGGAAAGLDAAEPDWLAELCEKSRNAKEGGGVRYPILGDLRDWLSRKKKGIEKKLHEALDDLEPERRKQYEREMKTAIQALDWLAERCERSRNAKGFKGSLYQVFGELRDCLSREKGRIKKEPLAALDDLEPDLRKQYEREMKAAIQAANWLAGRCERSQNAKGFEGSLYQIFGDLHDCLSLKKEEIKKRLTDASPLAALDALEPELREPEIRKRYERELKAAIEAEYRRERAELLSILQWFLRDVWLQTLRAGEALLRFPDLAQESRKIADRISAEAALENIKIVEAMQQTLNNTNVQETLALDVALLKISL